MLRLAFRVVIAVLVGPSLASAIDIEALVMPGPVIRGHADVETTCTRCHTPFRAEAQNDLCLDCHSDVGSDLRTSRGFHGRGPGVADSDCRSCHSEHLGREADVIGLDTEAFDHDFSDYPLKGAHWQASCDGCHAANTKFREAPGECADCHTNVDVHEGSLGTRCADCHIERSWSETHFDHATTRFPLAGKHRDVECGLCHPAERYEKTAMECQSCHGLNDVHMGRFDSDCGRCHYEDGWNLVRFDHDRDTKFPLNGRHRETSCDACHAARDLKREPAPDCVTCHGADDEHRGRNGPRCGDCHDESSWKTTAFDHDRSTDWPLRGAHRGVRCQACHEGTLYQEKLDRDCIGCHRADDVHRGQEGRECGKCHDEGGWTDGIFFDHDLTRFPLLGFHAVSACEQCHLTPRFKDAEIECATCHEDDVHMGRLGSACEGCHNPNAWGLWRFDHAARTGFSIRGAHEKLECHACHRVSITQEDPLPVTCGECHTRDDVHFGGFGRDCNRCHGDESWRDIEMLQ